MLVSSQGLCTIEMNATPPEETKVDHLLSSNWDGKNSKGHNTVGELWWHETSIHAHINFVGCMWLHWMKLMSIYEFCGIQWGWVLMYETTKTNLNENFHEWILIHRLNY